MNDLSSTPAGIGDNNPPPYDAEAYDAFKTKVRDFSDAAAEWKERGAIEDKETAEKANDFVSGARKLFKEIDTKRASEKKPHLDAGRAIDADFKKLTSIIETAVAWVKKPLQAYMQEQERLVAERKAEEERIAREEAESAARAAAQAEARNDIMGIEEAKEAAEAARKREEEAQKVETAKVGSATGGGRRSAMRTVRKAKITSVNLAFAYFRDRPELAALLVQLADAEIRAAKGADITLPGFEIITERKL